MADIVLMNSDEPLISISEKKDIESLEQLQQEQTELDAEVSTNGEAGIDDAIEWFMMNVRKKQRRK